MLRQQRQQEPAQARPTDHHPLGGAHRHCDPRPGHVGIECLSPLVVVAIGGLIAGTYLTLLLVPVLFHALESGRRRISTTQVQS